MRMWQPEFESMGREEMARLQLKRLQAVLYRVHQKVPFYRQAFERQGLLPGDIQSLEDLRKLPFTTKADLRDSYPYGMFAVPLREVVRIHSSSGTTGKPTVVGYTRNDLLNWSDLVARFLTSGGVTREDVVQISFGYGLFTGGFGLHYGAERIGASVIPVSAGNTRRQIMIMQDFKTTALVCTPTYALYLAEVMSEMGVDPRSLSLRVGLFGSEPWSESMRQQIEERLGILATDNYGLSEIIGPGVAGECEIKEGLHLFEDHFIPEIIDPSTQEVLPYGQEGELVLTTLTKEAFPLIRYRTGDITSLNPAPCRCGRTLVRMARVSGRTDDMLIIRGVNVYPSQIEQILLEIDGTLPHYQIIVDRKGALDDLEVLVEVSETIFFDEMKRQREVVERIEERLRSNLGVSAKVKLVEPKAVERFEGKARRVVDKRKP
ncbi:MAG: phenylacetate--CoA ligase [candidate division NC10 bacterium]|nr:phenylacetate--CoA ligase [candidate division NC10 bacterium]